MTAHKPSCVVSFLGARHLRVRMYCGVDQLPSHFQYDGRDWELLSNPQRIWMRYIPTPQLSLFNEHIETEALSNE